MMSYRFVIFFLSPLPSMSQIVTLLYTPYTLMHWKKNTHKNLVMSKFNLLAWNVFLKKNLLTMSAPQLEVSTLDHDGLNIHYSLINQFILVGDESASGNGEIFHHPSRDHVTCGYVFSSATAKLVPWPYTARIEISNHWDIGVFS